MIHVGSGARDRYGDPVAGPLTYIAERTTLHGDCWQWTGQTKNHYGFATLSGKRDYAHRVSWKAYRGEIPEGLELDHLCRNRLCVNPWHLELVTGAINKQRAHPARTTCPAGHPYAGDNLYVNPNSGGKFCRTCHRKRERVRKGSVPTMED